METNRSATADQRVLINALTLISLGLSVLFLNSWDNVFVRTSVGLFWGSYFLILNGPDAVRLFRRFGSQHESRRRSFRSTTWP
jgi:hypothetical protein